MRAHEILQTGIDALKQRAEIRDAPSGERSAGKAADILTAWTGSEWTEVDVWRCLLAVKMARESQGKFHMDDLIDGAAYFSLLGEARARYWDDDGSERESAERAIQGHIAISEKS